MASVASISVNSSCGSTGQCFQVSAAVIRSPMMMQWDFVWNGEAVGKFGKSVAGLVMSRPDVRCRAPLALVRYQGVVSLDAFRSRIRD